MFFVICWWSVFSINSVSAEEASSTLTTRSRRGKYPALELFRQGHNSLGSSASSLLSDYGFSAADISHMKSVFPSLFTKLTVDDAIYPRLQYLQHCLQTNSHPNLMEEIIQFPFYFGYDLEQVIAVRHAYAHYRNITMPLQELLQSNDDEFASKFSLLPQGREFVSFKKAFLRGGLHAVREADAQMLGILMRAGYRASTDIDRSGRTLVHWASSLGRLEGSLVILKLLIEGGHVDPLSVTSDGSTAMMWAATGGDLSVCKYLYSQGCSVIKSDADGSTPFMWAAGSGAVDICEWIREVSPDVASETRTNKFGCLPIHFAASGGQIASCEYLRRVAGEQVLYAANGHGHDSLTKAVTFKQHAMVEYLCARLAPGDATALILKKRPWNDDQQVDLLEIAALQDDDSMSRLLKRFVGS